MVALSAKKLADNGNSFFLSFVILP